MTKMLQKTALSHPSERFEGTPIRWKQGRGINGSARIHGAQTLGKVFLLKQSSKSKLSVVWTCREKETKPVNWRVVDAAPVCGSRQWHNHRVRSTICWFYHTEIDLIPKEKVSNRKWFCPWSILGLALIRWCYLCLELSTPRQDCAFIYSIKIPLPALT